MSDEGQLYCQVCDRLREPLHFHEPHDHVCDACKEEVDEIPPPSQFYIEQKKKLTAHAQRQELLQREMALRLLSRRRFLPFVQKFRPKYQAGWVHEDIARRLERFMRDVEERKSPRLLICMPPRAGKSELTSRNFPAWVMGHHPEWEIIAASHTQSLAMSFSRYIRDLLRDPAYQAIFPDTKLDPDSQSVENWMTTQGGGYMAAGVGTGITGRGCHCLPLSERIYTNYGLKSLSELIKDRQTAHHALTYSDGRFEYRKINAFVTRRASAVYKLVFENGKQLLATGEHPVCVCVGEDAPVFRRMDELRAGESVVTFERITTHSKAQGCDEVPGVSDDLYTQSIKTAEFARSVRKDDAYVQPILHGGDEDSPAHCKTNVRGMWGAVHAFFVRTYTTLKAWGRTSFLFQRLLREAQVADLRWREPPQLHAQRGCVFALWEGLFTSRVKNKNVGNKNPVLFKRVLPQASVWSPYPEGYRSRFATILPRRIQEIAERDTKRSSLCRVYVPGQGCSSSRRESGEQSVEQSGSCMPSMPYEAPCFDTTSIIASIERIDGEIEVGDLEVDGSHNFIHESSTMLLNCLIVDDPVKDMEQADSQLVRDNTWEWYLSTAYTRLAPGGGVLGILTLWNEDDWGGRVILNTENGEGDQFEIVRYPAINEGYAEYLDENEQMIKVYPGQTAPETATLLREPDSALHPERYNLEMLLNIKKAYYSTGHQRVWSALYQQNPTPEEGLYFTKDMVKYGEFQRRSDWHCYQAWDFAITEKNLSDWTVCATIWQDEDDNLIIADILRFRSGDGIAIVDAMIDQYVKHNVDHMGVEDGQIWKSLKTLFERRCRERGVYPNYDVLVPITDKLVRAGPMRGRMQMGKVFVQNNRPWVRDFISELLTFPGGRNDDQIDGTSWCVRLALSHSAPRKAQAPKLKSWKDKLRGLGHGIDVSHMAA